MREVRPEVLLDIRDGTSEVVFVQRGDQTKLDVDQELDGFKRPVVWTRVGCQVCVSIGIETEAEGRKRGDSRRS